MSNFFHSAAMTLLSSTLRTLLSKYIIDVDVEGVNLPYSLSSSSWGVRLKNVKLRQGLSLKELPGTLPRRRKTTDRQQPKSEEETNPPFKENDHFPSDDDDKISSKKQQKTAEADPSITPSDDPNFIIQESNGGKVPPKKSSSWFSYFSSSRNDSKVVEHDNASSHPPSNKIGESSYEQPKMQDKSPDDTTSQAPSLLHTNIDKESSLHVDELLIHNAASTLEVQDQIDFDDESMKLILRLGHGGTIGTLDVRLLGKDIHVLVEDAFVTVEVVRVSQNNTAREDPNKNASTEDGAPATAETPTTKRNQKTHQKKPLPDPKTVGERIIAENRLARLFSMIPNLFLRDIRLRIVIRDETVVEDDPEASANGLNQFGSDETNDQDYSIHDTMVELTVEYFSVTDGADPMARFDATGGSQDEFSSSDEDSEDEDTLERMPSTAYSSEEPQSRQEYLTKHIKTGRGPDGGIVLRVFPPGESGLFKDNESRVKWARDRWVSATDMCVLRLSGLDVHTRIFTGTKQSGSLINAAWFYEDNYDIDALLFGGVDYVAPAPQLKPLPPMEETDFGDSDDEPFWRIANATVYTEDENGILHSSVKSNFHRFCRGLLPEVCEKSHLPSEYCSKCWSPKPGIPIEHELDGSLPMPGFVLSISIRDRLELNVDSKTLETIKTVLGLVKNPNPVPVPDIDAGDQRPMNNESLTRMSGMDWSERSLRTNSSGFDDNYHQSHASFRSTEESVRSSSLQTPQLYRSSSHDISTSRVSFDEKTFVRKQTLAHETRLPASTSREEAPKTTFQEPEDSGMTNAFPKSMQPEKVEVLGLYIGNFLLRIHVLEENQNCQKYPNFRFWEIKGKCLTLDHQRHFPIDKSFRDVRLDLGHISIFDYTGVEKSHLCTLGLRQRVVEFDEMTIETLMTKEGTTNRPPWPNTATVLLDLQVPVESLVYEDRERHGLQLRMIDCNHSNDFLDRRRSLFTGKLGAANIDMPYVIKDEVQQVFGGIKSVFRGPQHNQSPTVNTIDAAMSVTEIDSLMKYKITLDGGRVNLYPRFDVTLPFTTFSGERSSHTGISLETVIKNVAFRYGVKTLPTISQSGTLSIENFVALPENIRLRILMFLEDLGPLESAFCAKREKNSFLRCSTLNKQIVRIARRREIRGVSTNTLKSYPESNRRQEIMSELLQLDDDTLEDIWEMHQVKQKKNSRRK